MLVLCNYVLDKMQVVQQIAEQTEFYKVDVQQIKAAKIEIKIAKQKEYEDKLNAIRTKSLQHYH